MTRAADLRRKGLVILFLSALLIRWMAIEAAGANRLVFGDSLDYVSAAESLCREHRYPDRGTLPFFRAPLVPFFIAATTACDPSSPRRIKYIMALADAATAAAVGMLAWLLFRRSDAAFIATILSAVDPFFIAGVTDIRSEPLFMLCLTVSLVLLMVALTRDSAAAAAGCGMLLALAALARPAALICLPLFAAAPWVTGRLTPGRRVLAGALIAALAAVTLAPWTLRNAHRFHELIVVNDAGGYNFWRGATPEIAAISRIHDPAEYRRATEHFEVAVSAPAAREIEATSATPGGRSQAWMRRGLGLIRRDPATYLHSTLRKAFDYWRPWLNPQEYGRATVAASAMLIGGLFVLAGLGMKQHAAVDGGLVRWILLYLVVVWLVHVPYQVVVRFRIPFTDPLFIAFASLPLADLGRSTLMMWVRRGAASAG
jgi:4-amino-4-deoxy-L-arabinose transferase-like glycosyltransferase